MSQFIVSARKYRPTTFDSVVGQEQVTQTLSNAIAANKIAQAYLFCGPRGVGKTTCARIFAKEINKGAMPEGADLTFNIFELDAASNNSVEDIRTITDQVRIPPQVGKYKVYIIDEVHMLSQAAFNAFLKTLEEPPPYAIFILATTEKHKILPTILSRCQIYDFKRISVKDIVPHLAKICEEENITYEQEALPIIAQKADGALRDALSIFDRLVSFNSQLTYQNVLDSLNILDYEYYFKVTDAILQQDAAQLMMYFDEILRQGFEGDTFISGLNQHFRDLLMCQNKETLSLLEVGEQLQQRYAEQAGYTPTALLLNGLNLFNTCEFQYKTANNKRLHVELALLKVCYLPNAIEGQPLSSEVKKKPEQQVASEPTTPQEAVNPNPEPNPEQQESQPTAPSEVKQEVEATTDTIEGEPSDDSSSEVALTPTEESDVAAEPSPEQGPVETSGPKRKRKRKSRLFEDLSQEQEDTSDDEAEEPSFTGERPNLNPTHLAQIETALKAKFDPENDQSLRTIIDNTPPQLDGHFVKWQVRHKVQWELMSQNRYRINEVLTEVLPEGFEIQIEIDPNAEQQEKSDRPLTAKDKLQRATEKNPHVKLMQERLDLDLEY